MLKLFNVYSNEDMMHGISSIIQSGNIASGDYISKFESKFSEILNIDNVLSVNNMTSAIELALYLSGIREGDEVLATSFNCLASTSPLAKINAKVTWVDLQKQSPLICIEDLKRKISSKSKALILYHTAGYVAEIKKIKQICDEYNVILIEDCNNTFLGRDDETPAGLLGDFSIFSFYPNRPVNGLEGAILKIKDNDKFIRAKKLRRFGINPDSFRGPDGEINPLSDILEIGYSFNLNNLSAFTALSNLDTLSQRTIQTRKNAEIYKNLLIETYGFKLVNIRDKQFNSYWVFFVLSKKRADLLKRLKYYSIQASVLHYPNHNYSAFNSGENVNLPNTNNFYNEVIALPVGYWLNEDDIKTIVEIINEFNAK